MGTIGKSACIALALGVGLLCAPLAQAAGPPQVDATWATDVTATSASLHAEVNPEGLATTYRFEYLTEAAFQAGGESFSGAARAPSFGEAGLGSEESDQPAFQHLASLVPNTVYRYRIVATNSSSPPGGTPGTAQSLTTEEAGSAFELPDNRGWEMVSPIDKNGGAVQGFGANSGGDVLQAAVNGNAITYSSSASFGQGAQGAPTASQYIATRHEEEGWASENITTPSVSGSYGNANTGVPYQLFSTDLSAGLLLNGRHCRGSGAGCPVANPPLPGTGAPPGYQNYYLRNDGNGSFQALLTATPTLPAEEFDLSFSGASPDLRHVVLSTCAALTPGATEVTGTEGCDPTKPNLYEYAEGQLKPINVAPDAELAAQGGSVSADGSRVYFTEAGKLWLREGVTAPHELAEGGEFQTATPSGAFAFFTKEEHLFRYDAATHAAATDLTPSGGVQGMLGASEDGTRVYYATAAGIFSSHSGTTTTVTATPGAAATSDYPPSTGTARVTPDGAHLAFLSTASLTGYDNTDQSTGQPDSEVYLYDATAGPEGTLACISCNPTNERPLGPSTIPGAVANGKLPPEPEEPTPTDVYKPRNLSTSGSRLFFDSRDALVPQDASAAQDVYQWEVLGEGTCQKPGGCLSLISSGKSSEASSFTDASAGGHDAFFLTGDSLVARDPGSVDLYDAREGGGFPEPEKPIECDGDACQSVPSPPEDPAPGTLVPGSPNPPVSFPKTKCKRGFVRRHGKCVKKSRHHKKHKRAAAQHRGGRR